MSKTLITGTVAYDVMLGFEGSFLDTIRPEELERLSVSHFAPRYSRHHGGTGANIAWTLKLLGGDPLLVATVGNDGGDYISLLQKQKIDVQHVAKLDEYVTATAIIGTDSGGRQIAFFHPGADSHSPWPEVSKKADNIGWAIVSPRDMQMMIAAMDWCDKADVPVFFDPGQQVHAFGNDEILRLVKKSRGVIVNEYEWNILRGKLRCTEEDVIQYCPLTVITRAERGVTIIDASGINQVPACTADRMVNPTGAGDAFRAGLLRGLEEGWSTVQSARLGAAIASFVVEIDGTLLESINQSALNERMEQTYGESLPPL
jgi:adenosine kinase